MFEVKGKRVLVMGLGVLGGGEAITRWLIKQGAIVTVTDNKTRKELKDTIATLRPAKVIWHLGKHLDKDFLENDIIIQNPAVPSASPYLAIAKERNIPIYNEAGIFFLIARRPIIAVTGTRGKSTTSTLIFEMLKKTYPHTVLAGNRGDVSMFSIIDSVQKRAKNPIVLELSSWQVEGLVKIKKSPETAVLTNLYPDHLNRYPSKAAYYKVKQQLFAFQKKSDLAVLNYDNKSLRTFAQTLRSQVRWFSMNNSLPQLAEGVYKQKDALYYQRGSHIKRVADLTETLLKGSHNHENIAAAIVVARAYKVSVQDIQEVLKKFKGAWGRLSVVKKSNGITYVNDTAATTPEALIACIATYPGSIIIAGGENKGLSYIKLSRLITKESIKALILLPGSASDALLQALKKEKQLQLPPIRQVKNLKTAVAAAQSIAKPKDRIVLSPGAASFNQFVNEFDRGEQFEKLLRLRSCCP